MMSLVFIILLMFFCIRHIKCDKNFLFTFSDKLFISVTVSFFSLLLSVSDNMITGLLAVVFVAFA